MVDKISGLGGQSPKAQTPQEPGKKSVNKPITVMKGMTVADVQKYGSEAQKLVAGLFDCDMVKDDSGSYVRDGIFTEGEAEYFNNHDFTLTDNLFTMYDRKYNQTLEIKYSNIDDLKNMFNYKWNEPSSMTLYDENGKMKLHLGDLTEGGKITLDLTEKTVTADGVKGSLWAFGEKVTVRNSDLGELGSSGVELEIENTRDKRRIGRDKATKVRAGKDTNIKTDDASKIDITRDTAE